MAEGHNLQEQQERKQTEVCLRFVRFCLDDAATEFQGLDQVVWPELLKFGVRQTIMGVLFHGVQKLSNADHLPETARQQGQRTYRTILVDGEEYAFSQGFTELHTKSYEEILVGKGFSIGEARQSIQVVHDIRNATPVGLVGDYHPLARQPLTPHPFGWKN